MSGKRWPNAVLEREWLALRWYMGLVGIRALVQHRTNGWQLSWPDEQNDIGLTSFVDVGPTKVKLHLSTSDQQKLNCGQIPSVDPTNDCYLG